MGEDGSQTIMMRRTCQGSQFSKGAQTQGSGSKYKVQSTRCLEKGQNTEQRPTQLDLELGCEARGEFGHRQGQATLWGRGGLLLRSKGLGLPASQTSLPVDAGPQLEPQVLSLLRATPGPHPTRGLVVRIAWSEGF